MWLVRKNTPATPLPPGLAQLMKLTTFTCLLNLTCDLRAESASSSAVYKCTPNSKRLPILNLTPNSKTSLRIPKSHSEFQNLTPNSKTSLRIPKSHSEFQNLTPNSKILLRIPKPHSEFQKLTPNSKTSLRIPKAHSEF